MEIHSTFNQRFFSFLFSFLKISNSQFSLTLKKIITIILIILIDF